MTERGERQRDLEKKKKRENKRQKRRKWSQKNNKAHVESTQYILRNSSKRALRIGKQTKSYTQYIYLLSSGPERSLSSQKLIQSDPQSEIIYRVVVLLAFQ